MLKIQEINEIIKSIDRSSISEFTFQTNGTTIAMKKNSDTADIEQQYQTAAHEQTSVKEGQEESVPDVSVKTEKVENIADYDYEILSPIVGTLYTSPSPDSDAYVSEGSEVKKDTVVCIIEAMKLFNEVEAEVTGEITEILAEDGGMVEYGQPLFRVKVK
ncbi:acetyl-CoA carboxylase biotin carboxyl carrier protein [Oceanobacillus sojae]|uniref:acetyl-CoA carboxylase biotin carboxyl carrier protein n=1 Tax=Oceanobacillus sojae TaxID=582851 RepID=UPI0021A6D0CB|nr:acetyl-CoA carboxylase biotin carboxyl carrier protein [Oceanobacillus sojae]MCT1903600.1 acetyl-CoA carboxylase biotin carboxyl carrier protein [Oceanobacillus sojae]